jgi:hypothetical protein
MITPDIVRHGVAEGCGFTPRDEATQVCPPALVPPPPHPLALCSDAGQLGPKNRSISDIMKPLIFYPIVFMYIVGHTSCNGIGPRISEGWFC